MTEVEFHFNVGDKLSYSCRLLRKAVTAGSRLLVTGEPAQLTQLDELLWTFAPTSFLPHCQTQAEGAVRAASPVLLSAVLDAPEVQSLGHGVLVNLGSEVPVGFERFERFIEVVGSDEADRQAARARWSHYKRRGYGLTSHDRVALAGAA
jgi:DNA polymerase-3 subunit chi